MLATIYNCKSFKSVCVKAIFLVALFALIQGCAEEKRTDRPAAAPPTPEERFENLFMALKRQYDVPLPASPIIPAGESVEANQPVISARTKIEHEVIKPTEEGAPYRGILTISTRSSTTTILPLEEKKEEEQEADPTGDGDNQQGVFALPGDDPVARLGTSPLKTVETENVRTLEFEYREGEWVLLTEIDEENEPFTASAVEYALKRQ